ncbi:MAG TPA: G5 domain-containing protein, partial [Anaerolineaceae bacterium]|nr:G5 domain-containing protein [Anaerolineaceae bacterium]
MITHKKNIGLFIVLILLILSGCTEQADISVFPVEILVDGYTINDEIEIGSTIQTVLSKNNVELNPLDKVDPPVFTVLTESVTINIIRVEEKFETEEIVIPFEQQTVRNESLPDQQTLLIQPGVNGLQEITYRLLSENGQLFSRTEVRKVDLITPKPEIIMIGVQTPFSSIQIDGSIVYLSSGNAWMIENNTADRKPIVTNGKLDGRILKLSPDRNWLLFTQISEEENKINELWVLDLTKEDPSPVYLKVDNVIHFADWLPSNNRLVLVSTVEPRDVAPGWQANNNLVQLTLGANGNVLRTNEIIESNSGGIYGWWGTNFQISPDGSNISYSRPDSIGLVNLEDETLELIKSIIPYQTQSDWAWVTQTAWSSDSRYIYWVDHQEDQSISNQELSPIFNLSAYDLELSLNLSTLDNVGMFAYPNVLDLNELKKNNQLFFLQAIFPETSDSSRYRLMTSDRDGSNLGKLFPVEEMQGLEPQSIASSDCE